MEYPNDLLTFLLGIIVILTAVTGIMKWKSDQIKKDTTRQTTNKSDTDENHKEINQLKTLIISLQSSVADLCDRISRMEGAFKEHNRERKGNH
jgi:hypothetical protein